MAAMGLDTTRAAWLGVATLSLTAFAFGGVTRAAGGAPAPASVPAPPGDPSAAIQQPRSAPVSTRVASCPLPARVDDSYDLGGLPVFSKTLFYVRENAALNLEPRVRELLVGALRGVAQQEAGIAIESDSAEPPRWVTLAVSHRRCTLDLERVDAAWTLRSTLRDALRFVEGNLGPGTPGVASADRLFKIEFAATNGMLSALDGKSALLDADAYQKMRPSLATAPAPAGADERADLSRAITAESVSPETLSLESRRVGPRAAVAYARLASFGPGASLEVERWLAKVEAAHVKGAILDLRDNTGGLLDEAIKVADTFIKEGSLGAVVSRQRGKQQSTEFVAHDDGHEPGAALVVLVNHRTASASELVAAAVKSRGRGIVLGERTAGAATIRCLFDIATRSPRAPARRPAPSNGDFIQHVIDGKVWDSPAPPPVQPERESKTFGLVLVTGRLLASDDAEIEESGVAADVQKTCPTDERIKADGDCLVILAGNVIARAKDSRRSTLLSAAAELGASPGPPRPAGP